MQHNASVMREMELPSATSRAAAAAAITSAVGAPAARLASARPDYQTAFRLGTTELPSVTMLKGLPGPAVAVATLAICIYLGGSRPSANFAALAVIVFLVSSRILTTPAARTTPTGMLRMCPTRLHLLWECAAIAALVFFVVAALGLTSEIGAGALTAWALVLPAVLTLTNSAAARIARWCMSHASTARSHIIIGATEVGVELAKRIRLGGDSGTFLGYFDFRGPARLSQTVSQQWIGNCDRVAAFVQQNFVASIYIALPISTNPRMAQLLRQLRDTTASIYFVPSNIFSFDLIQPRCTEIHGIPALAVCETPHQGLPGLQKRVLDLLLALALMSLSGPLMLLIALAIKCTSHGPVLFKQRRYGLHGEKIFVYKFRSMTVCEDGGSVTQATRNDCRTTPVGRLLRRTSLDELPQILNVLQGTMSFVGPRPHAVAHNERYRKLISGYMIRHKVRPGITGWAQVNGLRGETDTLDKMRRRIEYDIDYLTNWSLWLDLKILLRTFVLVLHDENAY